ncbi:MAG: trimethylamine methyltransferase family protein [Desulfovermiculus sp.]|nr:trimethylamine methyltransferase family protein [Desulfovermiculus sp.]
MEAQIARQRLEALDTLIAEKELYQKIDQNARLVLSQIGMNISSNSQILKLLFDVDAIDLDNDSAPFVPLRPEYIERCLDLVPREFPGDPGPNSFGTGGTPPFYQGNGGNGLRPASRQEFENIVHIAAKWSNVVDIFSVPVQTEKSMSDYDCALSMEKKFSGLKMIGTRKMSTDQSMHLAGRDDWLDGTSLLTSFTPMSNMVTPFLRSAANGNNLLLLDLSISGASGPNSPEALLTFIHAQVLFMMILVQTIRPGTVCVHGGIPGVVGTDGDISYTNPSQWLLNEAMARLNLWVTGFPSAQSGGSTSVSEDLSQAIIESKNSRRRIRRYGAHIIRHALGTLGNLKYFNSQKFEEDCKAENEARKYVNTNAIGEISVLPLHLPEDDHAVQAILEFAKKGTPKITDHTLRNVGVFKQWEEEVARQEKLLLENAEDGTPAQAA